MPKQKAACAIRVVNLRETGIPRGYGRNHRGGKHAARLNDLNQNWERACTFYNPAASSTTNYTFRLWRLTALATIRRFFSPFRVIRTPEQPVLSPPRVGSTRRVQHGAAIAARGRLVAVLALLGVLLPLEL